METGLTILTTFKDEIEDFENLLSDLQLAEPILFFQNNYAVTQFGYYPYCLSIKATEDYLDFLSGKLQIFHFFDGASLQPIANKYGYNYEFLGQEEMYVEFPHKVDDAKFAISQHFFSRIFFEYISPSWLINDHFLQVKEMTKSLKENPIFYSSQK